MAIFKRGYKAGMLSGDLEFASLDFLTYCLFSYASGFPISATVKDLNSMKSLMRLYNVESVQVMYMPFRLLINCLSGTEANPLAFRSEVDAIRAESSIDSSLTFQLLWKYFARTQISYYFRDIDLAEQMRTEMEKYMEVSPGYFYLVTSSFFSGLVSVGMYRSSGKSFHRRRSQKKLAFLKKLLKTKGLNVLHK